MIESIKYLPAIRVPAPFGPLNWRYCLACAGMGSTLLIFILAAAFATFPGDQGALQGFRSNQSEWLDSAALAVTTLGGVVVAAALMTGLIALLVFARRRVDALVVLISAAPILAGFFLKEVVGRARPDYLILGSQPSSLSFPSGHALFAIVFGGLLIVLAGDLVHPVRLRRAIQIGLALLILAVARDAGSGSKCGLATGTQGNHGQGRT